MPFGLKGSNVCLCVAVFLVSVCFGVGGLVRCVVGVVFWFCYGKVLWSALWGEVCVWVFGRLRVQMYRRSSCSFGKLRCVYVLLCFWFRSVLVWVVWCGVLWV